jgi:hypothetical protein
LSVFASSIAACCSPHEEKPEIETASCHSQTHETKAEKNQAADSVETNSEINQTGELNVPWECSIESAPKVFAKNENIKIEKQSVTTARLKLPEAEFASSIISFQSVFVAPFYLSDSFYIYSPGRAESVEKSGHELVLDHPGDHGAFRVGAYSLDYLREIYRGKGLDVGLGAQATFNSNPQSLVPYYGGTNHQGFQIFLRVRTSAMNH